MLNFLLETFRLGLKNLRLHKLRSLLTALGIILGVTAVIVMIAIGEGSKQAALEQLQHLGAKNVLLRSVVPADSSQASQRATRLLDYGLRRADMRRLETLPTPNLVQIVPMRNTEQKVTRGDIRANANAVGTIPEAFDVINLALSRGRYFNHVDYENAAHVCVIGSMVARQLFPYGDPLGQDVQIGTPTRGTVVCTIVGVLEPSGVSGKGQEMVGRDIDFDLYFPLNVAQDVFHDMTVKQQAGTQERKNIELTEIWLQTDSIDHVEALAALSENILAQSHTGPLDYKVDYPISILRHAETEKKIFNLLLVCIACFALVVGGIGIMNIMLATVTERTREIGIRRALGAKQRHITLQFLIETTVISVMGGLIGIGLGTGMAKSLPLIFDNVPTSITTWSVAGSFVLSAMIGIGFGLYPAIKAAQMNPIEALRHE